MLASEKQSIPSTGLAASHVRIPAAAVCKLCGGISDMTLHRWLRDPAMAFPQPAYLGQRRYWREADVVAWMDAKEGRA